MFTNTNKEMTIFNKLYVIFVNIYFLIFLIAFPFMYHKYVQKTKNQKLTAIVVVLALFVALLMLFSFPGGVYSLSSKMRNTTFVFFIKLILCVFIIALSSILIRKIGKESSELQSLLGLLIVFTIIALLFPNRYVTNYVKKYFEINPDNATLLGALNQIKAKNRDKTTDEVCDIFAYNYPIVSIASVKADPSLTDSQKDALVQYFSTIDPTSTIQERVTLNFASKKQLCTEVYKLVSEIKDIAFERIIDPEITGKSKNDDDFTDLI